MAPINPEDVPVMDKGTLAENGLFDEQPPTNYNDEGYS